MFITSSGKQNCHTVKSKFDRLMIKVIYKSNEFKRTVVLEREAAGEGQFWQVSFFSYFSVTN